MKRLVASALLLLAAGCSSKPCVDGDKVSTSGWYGVGSTRSTYDPCPQKCCSPEWSKGCACSKRCPCFERHPK